MMCGVWISQTRAAVSSIRHDGRDGGADVLGSDPGGAAERLRGVGRQGRVAVVVEKNIGFAYVMNGMMNGGSGGPRTDAPFEVLRNK